MTHFTSRLFCLLLLIGLIGGYQAKAIITEQQVEIDAMKTAMENGESGSTAAGGGNSAFKDGKYQGEATGYGGPISVEVTIENGAITAIDIVSAANEDAAYFNMATGVIDDIIQSQSTSVDAVSGATYSSNGIKNAVAAAAQQALNN